MMYVVRKQMQQLLMIVITQRFQYFLLQNIPFEIIIYIILFELRKAGYTDQISD